MKNVGILGITFLLLVGMVSATQIINAGIFKADVAYIDQILGLSDESKVNITGLIISDGQIIGYYNSSYIETLLDTKANQTDLEAHENNKSNSHDVTATQVGAYRTSEVDTKLGTKADEAHAHTIGTANISDSAVTSAKIAAGTIASTDLADNAVTSAKIDNGTITNADIGFNYAGSTSKGGIATDSDKLDNKDSTAFLQVGTNWNIDDGSKALNTTYENTAGKKILVFGSIYGYSDFCNGMIRGVYATMQVDNNTGMTSPTTIQKITIHGDGVGMGIPFFFVVDATDEKFWRIVPSRSDPCIPMPEKRQLWVVTLE